MPHKLLLADDSVTIQRVIELTFADEDVDVVAVSDGAQAIEKIAAAPPDIVLADTAMPERDGYEVAEFVKSDISRKHIPVVLLTGAFEPVDEVRADSIGCDGVLVKPFEPQQVVAKVRELLAMSEGPVAAPASDATVVVEPTLVSGLETADVVVEPSVREKATPSPGAAPAVPTNLGDDELTDYLDQLDEAFAGLEGVVPAAPAAATSPAPLADAPAATTEPAPPVSATTDSGTDGEDWDLGGFVAAAHIDGETIPPPVEAARALAAEPAGEPPSVESVTPEASETTRAPEVPVLPALEVPPVVVEAPPAAPAALVGGEQTVLAQAFSAFLAAELGAPLPTAEPREPELTDQVVDELVSRVVERLTDRVLRETTAEIVSRVAEQLVREEIDRIKGHVA